MKPGWLILTAGFMAACLCPTLPAFVPGGENNQPTPARPATRTPVKSSPVSGENFSMVRLYPGDGSLEEQLAEESGRAGALGQHMFVEFDAAW